MRYVSTASGLALARAIRFLPEPLKRRFWSFRSRCLQGVQYWNERAALFGVRSVLNIAHTPAQMDAVTAMQEQRIFDAIRSFIPERLDWTLDFGCGPGRFRRCLTEISKNVVGVDPVASLLRQVEPHDRYHPIQIGAGRLPLKSGTMDVVWVCLVLGGIDDVRLSVICNELQRVLRPGGLLIAVENTTALPDSAHWHFRSVAQYRALFYNTHIECVGAYVDCGEEISIMVGPRH